MTMLEIMLVVAFAGAVIYVVGAGLVTLAHQNAVKRSNGLAHFVCNDVKKMLSEYTEETLRKTLDITIEMQKKMMEELND